MFGHKEIAEILLNKYKLDINLKDMQGLTALHRGIYNTFNSYNRYLRTFAKSFTIFHRSFMIVHLLSKIIHNSFILLILWFIQRRARRYQKISTFVQFLFLSYDAKEVSVDKVKLRFQINRINKIHIMNSKIIFFYTFTKFSCA